MAVSGSTVIAHVDPDGRHFAESYTADSIAVWLA